MSKAARSTRSTASSEPSESCAFARELSTALRAERVRAEPAHSYWCVRWAVVPFRAGTGAEASAPASVRLQLSPAPPGLNLRPRWLVLAARSPGTRGPTETRCKATHFDGGLPPSFRRNFVTSASRFGVRPDDLSPLDRDSVSKPERECDESLDVPTSGAVLSRPRHVLGSDPTTGPSWTGNLCLNGGGIAADLKRRLGRSGPRSPSAAGKQLPGSLPSARRGARPSSATRRHRLHGPALQASARRGP